MDIRTEGARDYSLSADALHKLTQWLSPAFPVGAYAYSHGLEWAVEAGDVHDAVSAEAWIFGLLAHGAGRNDGVILAHAYGAADNVALAEVVELAAAFVSGAERLQETMEMGAALAKGIGGISHLKTPPHPSLPPQRGEGTMVEGAVYPVVLGVAARAHGIPLAPTISMYLHSFGANLISAAQRLVPLGQMEGQKIVANMSGLIVGLVPEILAATLDDLGGCAFAGDMASMKHEMQKVRLFRT